MSMKVTRAEFIGTERMDEDELRDFAHDLLAENEKLREEVELVGTAGYLLAMKQLKDENKKLRSKARHMYVCIQHASYDEYTCETCPYDNENGACDFEKQLGELGIEVPE